MLRVAVVGLGGIGKTHTRCYDANPDAQLVALCDLLPERVDPVAKQYGVAAYHDIDEMLNNEELDAVSVATAGTENGSHHYEPTMRLLEAGKHVLVEKPISNDIEQAREMVAKAKEKGVLLGVNLNHRFTPAAERAKKLQADGQLGDVLFVNMALWINNPNESSPWFHLRALHPHSIDVMRYFGGPIRKVQAFMPQGAGPADLVERVGQRAVRERRGRAPDRQLRRQRSASDRALRGRRQQRAAFVIENVFERLEFFPRARRRRSWSSTTPIMGGMTAFRRHFNNRINTFVEQVRPAGRSTRRAMRAWPPRRSSRRDPVVGERHDRGGQRVNIVLIALDTQRADHLGCYGYDRPTSPFIDSIAAPGVVFEQCIRPQHSDPPELHHHVRGQGSDHARHRQHRRRRTDQGRRPAAAGDLADNGYATGAVDNMGRHFSRGFEKYRDLRMGPLRSHRAGARPPTVNDQALPLIDELMADERPFFLLPALLGPAHALLSAAGLPRSSTTRPTATRTTRTTTAWTRRGAGNRSSGISTTGCPASPTPTTWSTCTTAK